jgi:hypothetical protein
MTTRPTKEDHNGSPGKVSEMTTAATLESLTDRSRFEQLATSVLRKAEPRYAAIVHTGVNALGETIVSPIDGLHLIPYTDPPHYIFVQHTTSDRSRLRGKWLSGKGADLRKATAEAKKVRRKQPNAVFTVVLTTNQRLNAKLVLAAYQYAKAGQIEIDIWEQSRLAGFLDTTADGQWLRKLYLGIDSQLLSEDLLRQLGRRSLDAYRQEVMLPGQSLLIHRTIVDDLLKEVLPNGPSVCLVIGRSGYGKSVATVQALEQWLSAGSFGLWLPAPYLAGEVTVEPALDAWLRSLHPSLQPDAGRVAINLAAHAGRFLVCIDDINQTPEAARLLRVVLGRAAPPSTEGQPAPLAESRAPLDALYQLVPVWPEQLSSLPSKVLEHQWVRTVAVDELLAEECSTLIQTTIPRLSTIEVNDYAKRLNYDPFLVGLFTVTAEEEMDVAQLDAAADDTIGYFLEAQLRDICSRGADLLPGELHDVLNRVAREMVHRRNLRPLWRELEDWLGEESKSLKGLRLVVQQGRVCRLDSDRRLEFRHDRLQERFLVAAMAELLQLPEPPNDILMDPYYATTIGKALACTELAEERLTHLRNIAPWTIFDAVREVGDSSNRYHNSLFEAALFWARNESKSAHNAVLTHICWTLLETDSSRVLSLIDVMEPNWLLMIAGLRNGSAEYGMRFLRTSARHDFEPGKGDARRDRIVEHAGLYHAEQIARQTRGRLRQSEINADDARSYLALLGHFRFVGFDQEILSVWRRYQDGVLAYAIWAACRCELQDVNTVLGPLIERFGVLPVREEHADSPSSREYMALYLGWGFRRGITREALEFLVDSGRHSGLCRDVARMVEGVDQPDAIEFVARHLADGGGSNLWSHLTGIGDGEPQFLLRSASTTNRLRSLWQSLNEAEGVRVLSFCLWLATTGGNDLTLLRSIDPGMPFYRYAVQHRIKRADRSVVPDLVSILRSDEWWWVLAHRVWCDTLRDLASETLEKLNGQIPVDFSGGRNDLPHNLAELLVKIPPADAERLLQQNWGHLKYSPSMVHAAFRIGTPICADLAREALTLCPASVDIFFLFSSLQDQPNEGNPITLRHLRNLEPYLDRMNRDEILFLAWETEMSIGSNPDVAEWIRTNLVPRLPLEDQSRVEAADQYFLAHLDRAFAETGFDPHLGFIFQGRRGQTSPERRLRLLDVWLSHHRTVRGLKVAGECLKYIGTRRELELLNRYQIEGDAAEVERIKGDASFRLRKRSLL